MTWFRSNVRPGSRLALFALAIQFLLSFGHFHGNSAQALSPSVQAERSGHHHSIVIAAMKLDRVSLPSACSRAGSKTSDHRPPGLPIDDCAICAVMALAGAMVAAAPPDLLAPQMAAFAYVVTGAGFAGSASARVAFQPRAPPVG